MKSDHGWLQKRRESRFGFSQEIRVIKVTKVGGVGENVGGVGENVGENPGPHHRVRTIGS